MHRFAQLLWLVARAQGCRSFPEASAVRPGPEVWDSSAPSLGSKGYTETTLGTPSPLRAIVVSERNRAHFGIIRHNIRVAVGRVERGSEPPQDRVREAEARLRPPRRSPLRARRRESR